MKREKARLEELRSMSYADYLQTPEWQETQKAALKRAGNRCQVCRTEGLALRVYHTTLDTLGMEQEGDVIALCKGCYDHLSQKIQRFAAETAEQSDDSDEGRPTPQFSLLRKAMVFTPSALILDGLFFLLHAPLPAELFGLGAAIALAASSPKIYAGIREALPESWQEYLDERAARREERTASSEWSNWDRLLGRHLNAGQIQEGRPQVEEDLPEEEVSLFQLGQQQETPLAIDRLTVEAICEHIKQNSYMLYVGRSLLKENGPAVPLFFYKQHIEIIGVTQRGKSSMAGALMDIITRTHDPEYVQLALLDMEDQTSNLFAHLPHVMTWRGTKLHARSVEEVIAQLDLIVEIMEYRYTLPAVERANLPLLIVYLEEFLALKNEMKNRINLFKGEKQKEAREEAIRAYAQLALTVNKIALRGLKARVQFLLCAQVDYADKEFREALAMFGIRFSFGVDPDAARAAGFTANELLARNSESQRRGEAVLESSGVKELVLAPDYDLEQRIIRMEAGRAKLWPAQRLSQRPVPETTALCEVNQEAPEPKRVYHTHEGKELPNRRKDRLQRQRGESPQITPPSRTQYAQVPGQRESAPQEARPSLPIMNLETYRKQSQHIPTLEEVVEAFPNQLPSRRALAAHFSITEYQASELLKQLNERLDAQAGQVKERAVKQ